MSRSTTSAEFFEQKYRENPDPWNFTHSDYEQSRYNATVAALGRRNYQRAFEPGCSVGELTWRLAQRCAQVDAMDISATAVDQARRRCREFANVEFTIGSLPHQTPDAAFDLVVLSEIGYYFEEATLSELGKMLVARMVPCGMLLSVHWLGTSKDHVLGGDRVHEILGAVHGLKLEQSEQHQEFRLDRWVRL